MTERLRQLREMIGTSSRPPQLAVETRSLTKRYGDVVAVEGLDLNVSRGVVYGLLGPKGAGKTTTLGMLLGLIRPTSGSARVMEQDPESPEALKRVGALLESPAFHPSLSGRDNLRGLARLAGVQEPKRRVSEVLDAVGLSEKSKDRYREYSLEMKQRLAVAAALLKDPELLILDEPTNGLESKDALEIRDLIRSFSGSGRTVLLSSHLMGEVEQVCDRVGIFGRGTLLAEGAVDDLRCREWLMVRAKSLEDAAMVAREFQGVDRVEAEDGALWLDTDPGRAAEIRDKLLALGVRVTESRPARRSLEDVFLRLTDGVEEKGV